MPKSWRADRPKGNRTGKIWSLFYMKRDEYSPNEIMFQREQVESSWSLGLLHSH